MQIKMARKLKYCLTGQLFHFFSLTTSYFVTFIVPKTPDKVWVRPKSLDRFQSVLVDFVS